MGEIITNLLSKDIYNPNDSTGYYWRYVECPTLDRKYLSPGSLFKIDNASCRQKADMHIFITSVFPHLIHLANTYNDGIKDVVDKHEFVEDVVDMVKMSYSVTSSILDIAEINRLDKIDYKPLHKKMTGTVESLLQTQLELTTKVTFNGEYDYVADGIVHTANQVITALKNCVPGKIDVKGCIGLGVDLTGDLMATFNNFAASIHLNYNAKKLNSVTCTLDYLIKYYGFGGNRKMLAESVGLSQNADNFVVKDVLAKTSVCNSSNMDYTLSLIEQYQKLIRTTNSLNYISQP